jgi:RNA polymerase sigma factor (sigma-70 family)
LCILWETASNLETTGRLKRDPYNDISDRELLDRFYQDNNNQWLGILMERYTLLLFGVCMKYLKNEEDAKDSVQQVFLKALDELRKYRVEYFKSWIYMVAKNHCLMKIRDRKGTALLNEDSLVQEADFPGPGDHLAKDRVLESLTESLRELNPEQKQCVTLFYLDKRSYQDIVDSTGFTLMQVKSHIQNGKRNLRIALERKMNKYER